MDHESTNTTENSAAVLKAPIEIDVKLNDKKYTVSGDVTLTLLANGTTIYETTKEIGPSDVKSQETEEGRTASEGPRRRIVAITRKEETATSSGEAGSSEPPTANGETAFHFPSFDSAKHTAQSFAQKVLDVSLDCIHFCHLPDWLRDNEFLHFGHRPPTPSFWACYRSIFRLHTETVNIWTHLLGCIVFTAIAVYYLTRPMHEIHWEEKIVFSPFFVGVIACLGLSFTFHTVQCHSERVGRFFNKLDYVGILLLIVGSFFPWVYYGFYCRREPKLIYLIGIVILGCICMIVTMWDRFSRPRFRVFRTVMFSALGLCGVVPFAHSVIVYGYHSTSKWLILMGVFYIVGGIIYAARIPERFFPGKCDIWWQSHQLFHMCVVAAAITHYRGITEMASIRLRGSWPCQPW